MPRRHRTASLLILPCDELPPCQAATAPCPSSSSTAASRRRAIGEQGQGRPLLPPSPLCWLQTEVQQWEGGLQPVPLPRRSTGPTKGTMRVDPDRVDLFTRERLRCSLGLYMQQRRSSQDSTEFNNMDTNYCLGSFPDIRKDQDNNTEGGVQKVVVLLSWLNADILVIHDSRAHLRAAMGGVQKVVVLLSWLNAYILVIHDSRAHLRAAMVF